MAKVLTPEAEEELADFQLRHGHRGNCSCHISPPCESCMHPGNPVNQAEDASAWVEEEVGQFADLRAALAGGAENAFYTTARDSNKAKQNEALALACTAETLSALLSGFDALAADLASARKDLADVMQAISDPENQPSQFGTVTLAMFEAIRNEASGPVSDERLDAAVKAWFDTAGGIGILGRTGFRACMQAAIDAARKAAA